jgi:ubiquinone/menaquinone biosynthesis C-methylase UbiE
MSSAYCCPRCQSGVEAADAAFVCRSCDSHYPIVCGIPDFRVRPDPYIGIEADRAKASHLDDRARDLDFEGLVRHYFDITPEVPPDLAARYRVGVLNTAPARANSCLSVVETEPLVRAPSCRILEIGCGSGPFLPALSQRYSRVVAVDVALRWLVIARKRLQELREGGGAVELVCACAENLPFADVSFDLVLAANVVEHAQEPNAMLRETIRILDRRGLCVVTTPNRMTLARDPHVGVWGVGLVPRRFQNCYVRWARDVSFERVKTLSCFELRSLFSEAGFDRVRVELPEITGSDLSHLGRLGRLLGRIYNRTRRLPLARQLFMLFGPFFQVVAQKGQG